jgi:hypothetical protein
MADTQRDIRVTDHSVEQGEDSREQSRVAATAVARMLANPRRVRRS